jgi:hypothetical protein
MSSSHAGPARTLPAGNPNRAAGWFFIHGKLSLIPANSPQAERKKLTRAWKNNLYGDGHAESKRPDEVEWRWNAKSVNAYAW